MNNILCLCANCHSLFDLGALWMDDELTVRDFEGEVFSQLTIHESHEIDLKNVKFHRNYFKDRKVKT